jgi:hypothetical protein
MTSLLEAVILLAIMRIFRRDQYANSGRGYFSD